MLPAARSLQVRALNAKSLSIGGIILLALSTWASRVTGLVTDDQLLIALHFCIQLTLLGCIILFFAAVSYGVSWGATEAYKRLYHHQKRWKEEGVKRKIYRCALYSGAGTMFLCGSFFLLAEDLTRNEKIVVGVFWLLACAFVGLTSPLVWRWTFDKVLPRFNRYVSGKTDERGENEAMDRPGDKLE
jgi:hypothetical protein